MNTQTLDRAVITVQRVIPAKDQGKSASVKDLDGRFYGFWPDKLGGVIRENETYEIEFSATVKNNTTYRDIRSAKMVAKPAPAQYTSQHAAQERQPDPRPEPPRATSPNGNGAGQYYRPTAPRDSERMFVCSTLNAFISTGRIDPARDHLTAAINELRAAYAATFGKDDQ